MAFFDIADSKDKLVTAFGVHAPPSAGSLARVSVAAERLVDVMPRVARLHDYQYDLLKYEIEHYRIQKICSQCRLVPVQVGRFGPTEFDGIYYLWGQPKAEGLGGGLRTLKESNHQVGFFMEHNTKPVALYVVNDSSADLGIYMARWRVSTSEGVIAEGSQSVRLEPNSRIKIRDFSFGVKDGNTRHIELDFVAVDGEVLAHNTYAIRFSCSRIPRGIRIGWMRN